MIMIMWGNNKVMTPLLFTIESNKMLWVRWFKYSFNSNFNHHKLVFHILPCLKLRGYPKMYLLVDFSPK